MNTGTDTIEPSKVGKLADPTKIKEDPLKALVREVIASGRARKDFKRDVKRHLIKTSTSTREITRLRIKSSHSMIDKYWKAIRAEIRENV